MQISSNYSMNGVPYENRRRQKDIPQFSTERAKQENKSINPYMEDTDFNEETFDMIGPNAPQEVKDAWIEAAKEEGDVDNIADPVSQKQCHAQNSMPRETLRFPIYFRAGSDKAPRKYRTAYRLKMQAAPPRLPPRTEAHRSPH